MTVHLFVSFVALVVLCWVLWRLSAADETQALSWPLLALAFAGILPLGFGPIIPISHFVFAATSDNITWYVVLGAAVWAASGFYLWRCVRRRHGKTATLAALGAFWVTMAFWYWLGVRLSQYEPGVRTPAVTDSPIYLAHWASVHLVLVGLLTLLFTRSVHRWGWLRAVVTGCLLVLYLILVAWAVDDLIQWSSRPDQALQRTGPHVTADASALRLAAPKQQQVQAQRLPDR